MSEEQCYSCERSVIVGTDEQRCPICHELLLLTRGSRQYRITGILGRGGFGKVYQATEGPSLQRACAIKSIKEDPPELDSKVIRNEVRLLSAQGHRLGFIPDIYDYWPEGGVHYIAMQFIEGETLDELHLRRALPPSAVVDFLEQMLRSLDALHGAGIVHRDIKPNNIKYNRQRGYVLLDFGLAGYVGKKTALQARTPDFAPPEQFYEDRASYSRTDQRTDLYSLAATTFFLLAGRAPRRALEWRDAQGVRPIAFPSEVPEPLRELLDHMLQLDPDKRPASADEALELLAERRKAILGAAVELEHQMGQDTKVPRLEAPIILPSTHRDGQFKPKDLDGRYGHITDIAVSPDGGELAVASTRGIARYRLPDGAFQTFSGRHQTVQQLAFVGDSDDATLLLADEAGLQRDEPLSVRWKWYNPHSGKRIAVAARANRLIEFSQEALVLREIDPPTHLVALHEDGIDAAALTPDGGGLAVAVGARVRIYRVASGRGELARTLAVAVPRVVSLQFSADGLLAVGGEDQVQLWRVADGHYLGALSGFPPQLSDMAFSPNGSLLAVAAGEVVVFNAHTRLRRLSLAGDSIFHVCFGADNMLIGASHEQIWAWSLQDGEQLFAHTNHLEAFCALALSPDGQTLAALNGRLHSWRLHGWRLDAGADLGDYDPEPKGLAFSPDGSLLAAGSGSAITIWDMRSGTPRERIGHGVAQAHGLSFADDGRSLLYVGADGIMRHTIGSPGQDQRIQPPTDYTDYHVAFARNGVRIAVFGSLAASGAPVGQARAAASLYGIDLLGADGTPHDHISAHSAVYDVTFAADNSRLVVLTATTVEIWALAPKIQRLQTLEQRANLVVAAPSGNRLAIVESARIGVVNLSSSSRKVLNWLDEHNEPVGDVVFTNGGETLISAGGDGVLRLWRQQSER